MPVSNTVSAAFRTEAVPAPTWVSVITLPQGTRNSPYSYDVSQHASGEAPLTFSTVTALPAGLSFSQAGVLAGTPTSHTASPLSILFTVTNEGGSANSTGTLVIILEGKVPQLTTRYEDLVLYQNGTVNIDLGNAHWSSNAGDMTFAIDGPLPGGLSFATDTGMLTGSAPILGNYFPFVVSATNSIGTSQGNAFSMQVTSVVTVGALNDAKMTALADQLGYRSSLPDMTLAWLKAAGATSDNVNDAWMEMLRGLGRREATRNDAWYALLGSQGHIGTITDREFSFWLAGGTLAPALPPADWGVIAGTGWTYPVTTATIVAGGGE